MRFLKWMTILSVTGGSVLLVLGWLTGQPFWPRSEPPFPVLQAANWTLSEPRLAAGFGYLEGLVVEPNRNDRVKAWVAQELRGIGWQVDVLVHQMDEEVSGHSFWARQSGAATAGKGPFDRVILMAALDPPPDALRPLPAAAQHAVPLVLLLELARVWSETRNRWAGLEMVFLDRTHHISDTDQRLEGARVALQHLGPLKANSMTILLGALVSQDVLQIPEQSDPELLEVFHFLPKGSRLGWPIEPAVRLTWGNHLVLGTSNTRLFALHNEEWVGLLTQDDDFDGIDVFKIKRLGEALAEFMDWAVFGPFQAEPPFDL
ncbi:MAG: hypothetical protein ACFCU3_04140 [Verrucomicrobiales bacterium]